MDNFVFEILPGEVRSVIEEYLNKEKISELRLRSDKPVMIKYGGKNKYVSKNGLVDDCERALSVNETDVREVVMAASEYSLYAYSSEIVKGYITISGGVRIGVCGSAVTDGGNISAIKDFSSVSIRFPHEIIGCGDKVYKVLKERKTFNALILSPPGCGKTTMLRDLSRLISTNAPHKNVLIVDERDEIASSVSGRTLLNVGRNVDVISNTDKKYAFENGIRSMCPDVIVTDELYSPADAGYIREAVGSGVDVLASAHAESVDGFKKRQLGSAIIDGRLFDVYVLLSFRCGVGTVESILDADLVPIKV